MSILSRIADYAGLERFWLRITQRYDKKLDSVTNKNNTVVVTNNNEIAVKIADDDRNNLMVKPGVRGGLYVGAPVLHKLTFGSDKQYVYDGTEDVTVPVYDGEYNT